MTSRDLSKLLLALVVLLTIVAVVFARFPGLDHAASGLFHSGTHGFWLSENRFLHAYRDTFNVISMGLATVCLILWIASLRFGVILGIPDRVWGFVCLLYLLGPGLLVNGILKPYSGRARPADVSDFGGDKVFTPVLQLADQCARNCSFTSGEGSGAAAFFISLLVIGAYIPGRRARDAVLVAGFAAALFASELRVIKGRHFLSDTLFSWLLVSLVAVLLAWWLLRERPDRIRPGRDWLP